MKTLPKVLLLIDFSEEYGRGILRGIAKYSQLFGPWAFCRMPPYNNELQGIDAIIKWAKEWGADGIIAQIQDDAAVKKLIDTKLPIIAQDLFERFSEIPNITGQYRETGRLAAEHFLQRGFTKFAFYGFDNIVWSRERLEGFSQRVAEAGFKTEVYQQSQSKIPVLWRYTQSPLSEWLLSLSTPTALMTCDDNQGQHVLEACKIADIKVPEQISIIGVDNDEAICNLSDPPLSSISLNTEKAGFQTAQLLEKMINGDKNDFYNIVVEPISVNVRRSSDIFAIEDKELAKALRYIYYNFKTCIQVDNVVAATACSRRVLEQKFARILHKSIMDEITRLRIEHVSQMLINTHLSIAEIADASGFSDEKNLARYFKMRKNSTPSEFRRQFSEFG